MSTTPVGNAKCFIKLRPEPAKNKKTILNTLCSDSGVYCSIKCTHHKDVIHLEIENISADGTTNVWPKIKEVMRLVLVLNFVEDVYGVKLTPLFQNSIIGNYIANEQEGTDSKDWYPKHSLSYDGLITTVDFKSTNPELEKVFEGLFINSLTTTNQKDPNNKTKSQILTRSSSILATDKTKSKSLINPQTKQQDDIEPEDSASNMQPSQEDAQLSSLRIPLKFGNGILKFGKFELDKRRPNQWSTEAIKALHQEDCPFFILPPTDPNDPLVTGQEVYHICYYLFGKDRDGVSILDESEYLAEQISKNICKRKDVKYILGVIIWLYFQVLERE